MLVSAEPFVIKMTQSKSDTLYVQGTGSFNAKPGLRVNTIFSNNLTIVNAPYNIHLFLRAYTSVDPDPAVFGGPYGNEGFKDFPASVLQGQNLVGAAPVFVALAPEVVDYLNKTYSMCNISLAGKLEKQTDVSVKITFKDVWLKCDSTYFLGPTDYPDPVILQFQNYSASFAAGAICVVMNKALFFNKTFTHTFCVTANYNSDTKKVTYQPTLDKAILGAATTGNPKGKQTIKFTANLPELAGAKCAFTAAFTGIKNKKGKVSAKASIGGSCTSGANKWDLGTPLQYKGSTKALKYGGG